MLDKNPIKVVTEATFLGVAFDRTLSYRSHAHYRKTNCPKALDILQVVGYTEGGGGADRKTLLCLYRALVWSKLDYVCIYLGQSENVFYRNWTLSITKFWEVFLEFLALFLWAASMWKHKIYIYIFFLTSKQNKTQKNVYELCSETKI